MRAGSDAEILAGGRDPTSAALRRSHDNTARPARGATRCGPTTDAPAAPRAVSAPHRPVPMAGIAVTASTGAEGGAADQLSAAVHEFAYSLGMDLLKREEGRATSMRSVSLLQAQRALLPVGEQATTLFEQALQQASS